MQIPFSVCISVYINDNPDHFKTALKSIYYQTVRPNEIVLVVDGPVCSEIDKAILVLEEEIPILKVVRSSHNMGHAKARQLALDKATNDLVAIMDSDDISLPDRFEKQLRKFQEMPELTVVGGFISEFILNPSSEVGIRIVPENNRQIIHFLKLRCPMNFVTVMFRKKDILNVGGIIDWYCEEDYFLWIRLYLSGYKFHNIQENLVKVRVGKEMYSRRGGVKYFKSEAKLQKFMLEHKIISFPRYIFNVIVRFIVQVLFPNKVRGFVFQKILRK